MVVRCIVSSWDVASLLQFSCLRRQESSDYFMLVDDHHVTTGSECNKIGVGYEAFSMQSRACERVFRSCLGNQLHDFYEVRTLSTLCGVRPHFTMCRKIDKRSLTV